jgi:hypothetical protein
MELKMNKKSRRQYQSEKISAGSKTRASSRASEFNPDYSPIIKDLKRIGLLAGSFLVALIILSFFLG